MLEYCVSTEISVYMQIRRRECFHRVKHYLHRSVRSASGVVRKLYEPAAGLLQELRL